LELAVMVAMEEEVALELVSAVEPVVEQVVELE